MATEGTEPQASLVTETVPPTVRLANSSALMPLVASTPVPPKATVVTGSAGKKVQSLGLLMPANCTPLSERKAPSSTRTW
jgi:hypothetical protein